ncbi:MAG: GNAT family N-acetyltransferase [Aggregatilineales bacterium]
MILNNISVTGYERRYRQAVNDLIFRSSRLHTHLDWHDVNTWMDTFDVPIRLAWSGEKLIGIMAASTPMSGTVWLRVIAIEDDSPPRPLLHTLWESMREFLKGVGVHTVAVLLINEWLAGYVPQMGFSYEEDIITLRRDGHSLPQSADYDVNIRPASQSDIRRMTEVDQLAFVPPWQLTFDDVRHAHRMAATCNVAYIDNETVGYQLSTRFKQTGHLARLAVLPEIQGHGIGSALLDDLIRYFLARNITTITVNTQSTNIRSQRVYKRYGFRRNGYDLPVWMAST